MARSRLSCAALLCALVAGPADAALIAYEGFDSPGELDGQAGGTGFSGAWTAVTTLTQVSDPGTPLGYAAPGIALDGGSSALQITGNSNNALYRPLPSVSQPEVYISFLLRFSGALADNHFVVLWHDVATGGDHTTVPNIGVKANRGDGSGSEDLMARIQLTGGAPAYAHDLPADTTVFVLGRLAQSGAGGGVYDRFDLWVDPASAAVGAPDATATGTGTLSSFSAIGVRTANIDDVFWIDELRYGTALSDVLPIPEVDTGALLALGLIVLALHRRRI